MWYIWNQYNIVYWLYTNTLKKEAADKIQV